MENPNSTENLMVKGKIQAAKQLKKMNWLGSQDCKLCGESEDVDHVIFRCAPARFIWCCLRDILDSESIPCDREELFRKLKDPGLKSNLAILCLFAAACWAIWLTRNDVVFRDNFIVNVNQIAHKMLTSLQQWRPLGFSKVALFEGLATCHNQKPGRRGGRKMKAG